MTNDGTAPGYPQPRATAVNAPMLDAWRRGTLALQKCPGCGKAFFYPRALCPHCWSDAVVWINASGQGRIVSFSLVHRGISDAFADELPVVLAEIELAEGALMIARVMADGGAVRSGMAVRLVPLPEAKRFPLPTFCLDT